MGIGISSVNITIKLSTVAQSSLCTNGFSTFYQWKNKKPRQLFLFTLNSGKTAFPKNQIYWTGCN